MAHYAITAEGWERIWEPGEQAREALEEIERKERDMAIAKAFPAASDSELYVRRRADRFRKGSGMETEFLQKGHDPRSYLQVGRNASHEFYLGWDGEGRLFRRAYGEGWAAPEWHYPGCQWRESLASPGLRDRLWSLNRGDCYCMSPPDISVDEILDKADVGYTGHF